MLETIFTKLPETFLADVFAKPTSFYFSLGDIKKSVQCSADSCTVNDGRIFDSADCVCKTSPEFFLKIWQENYRPGMKDFMAGTIKSNNPSALQQFLRCFGKDGG
jgi:putative sterol carrier protein